MHVVKHATEHVALDQAALKCSHDVDLRDMAMAGATVQELKEAEQDLAELDYQWREWRKSFCRV